MTLTPKQQWLVAGVALFWIMGDPIVIGLALIAAWGFE